MRSVQTPNLAVRRSRRAATTLILGLFVTSAAHAQWTVADPIHTAKNVAGWIEKHKQDLKEIQKWKDETEHYKQQLADAQQIFKLQGVPMTLDFNERPLNYGMNENCPGSKNGPVNADSVVSNAISTISSWRPLSLDNSNDLKKEMLGLCEQIVVTQNKRYNEAVKLLRNVQQRDEELKKLDGYRQGVGTSQGKLATSSNQLSAFAARTQTDVQYTQAVIKTYDEHIDNLKHDQTIISQRILEGGNKAPVSGLLQGAALKGTFAVLKSRDR